MNEEMNSFDLLVNSYTFSKKEKKKSVVINTLWPNKNGWSHKIFAKSKKKKTQKNISQNMDQI